MPMTAVPTPRIARKLMRETRARMRAAQRRACPTNTWREDNTRAYHGRRDPASKDANGAARQRGVARDAGMLTRLLQRWPRFRTPAKRALVLAGGGVVGGM